MSTSPRSVAFREALARMAAVPVGGIDRVSLEAARPPNYAKWVIYTRVAREVLNDTEALATMLEWQLQMNNCSPSHVSDVGIQFQETDADGRVLDEPLLTVTCWKDRAYA